MSSQLKIEQIQQGDQTIVVFSGGIDEDSSFENVPKLNSKITFDLSNVQKINSCGIREWIKFQDELDPNLKITYRGCSQVIVEQMNIIKGFVRAGGVIESFYAPYFDEENDEEVKILITPKEVVDGKAPVKKNAEGVELKFDEIEAQYFNFLKGI